MPSCAAAIAVARQWFDCSPPQVMTGRLLRDRVGEQELELADLVAHQLEPVRSSRLIQIRGAEAFAVAEPVAAGRSVRELQPRWFEIDEPFEHRRKECHDGTA